MLVLTHKIDEKLHIGHNVTVTILRIKGRAVKVGIEAPVDVRVLREALVGAPAHARENDNPAALSAPDGTLQGKLIRQLPPMRLG
jgi:carbon storage regulator